MTNRGNTSVPKKRYLTKTEMSAKLFDILERDDLKGLARFTKKGELQGRIDLPMQLIGNKRLNGRKFTERTAISRIMKAYLNG